MRGSRFPFLIAWRYLKPKRRTRFLSFITAVATIGVTFGTAALLVSLSILTGFEEQLRTTLFDFMGHIEVAADYGEEVLHHGSRSRERIVSSMPDVDSVSPFVRRESIIRTSTALEGVLLKGIDPDQDVSRLAGTMTEGAMLRQSVDTTGPARLVIGERLSNRIDAGVGDTVVLFVANEQPGLESAPMIERFVVSGLYRTGMAQYDDVYVFTTIGAARRLLSYGSDDVTGFDVLVHDPEDVRNVASRMNSELPPPHYARSVTDLFSSIFAWIDLQRLMIPVVVTIIAIVAVFNVISILLMTVLEKTDSIASLSTMGATPRTIASIFVSKGVLVTAIGLILGAGSTLLFSVLQKSYGLIGLDATIYVFDAVPISIVPWHYAAVILGTLVLSVLITLIPASIAARLRPVITLRFQ